jgi:nucleoid DNA-binding protein
MTLIKQAIAGQIWNWIDFPKNQAVELTEAVFEIIKSTLASGDDVFLFVAIAIFDSQVNTLHWKL